MQINHSNGITVTFVKLEQLLSEVVLELVLPSSYLYHVLKEHSRVALVWHVFACRVVGDKVAWTMRSIWRCHCKSRAVLAFI